MQEANGLMSDERNELKARMRHVAQRLLAPLLELDRHVQEINNQVRTLSWQSSICRRVEQVPEIWPLTETALEATIGENVAALKNGRQLVALPGLVPNQHSNCGQATYARHQ
ncbi:hypothetical protein [Cupriavidus pinatubonensis]|uniref:Uncharacterized protein n=1 Tax=Cupriavidus pinatubonensis TaxID=248026 RepID=A0ABM8Y414_9BURK|nr:hypothetical protein [Cupriavidus pinatubonensis]CAG9187513.1 hypothetical protein LMG23994_06958 [Cupriavidus pinatubonensis]